MEDITDVFILVENIDSCQIKKKNLYNINRLSYILKLIFIAMNYKSFKGTTYTFVIIISQIKKFKQISKYETHINT